MRAVRAVEKRPQGGLKPGQLPKAWGSGPVCILILWSKTTGEESEQARSYRKVYVAGSRLLRATIHCFRYFSRSCCSRSQMKSCLANRQYNQYFKSLNKSISEYLGISPFYFILLQNNLQGGVTTRMSLTHNTRQWLQNAKKKSTQSFLMIG